MVALGVCLGSLRSRLQSRSDARFFRIENARLHVVTVYRVSRRSYAPHPSPSSPFFELLYLP